MSEDNPQTPQPQANPDRAGEIPDLAPRPVVAEKSRRRRLAPVAAMLAVAVALGFVLVRTLGDSALFFYNADQAVELREDLDAKRFRVQGTPFGEPVSTELVLGGNSAERVLFPITFEGTSIDVIHTGAPAELFRPGVPVVLEGRWVKGWPQDVATIADGAGDGWYFASSEMVVKHDNDYRNSNPERLNDATRSATGAEAGDATDLDLER